MINRKAYHEYFITDEIVAGIKLVSSEVKSLADGMGNMVDSYVYISNNEVFLKGMHIPKWNKSSYLNHDEVRDRKLLLHKGEILKLVKLLKASGITIIPLTIFMEKGKFKVKIGLAKGKKLFDKRNSIKEKDMKRQTAREDGVNY